MSRIRQPIDTSPITEVSLNDSGGVIPGATVTIVNLGTGETFHATSSDRGTFSFPILEPVEYRITAELQGFKPAVVKRVNVDTATTASVTVKLEVGALSDEGTVTAEGPLVNISSGTPGQTITERQIVEMPLNNNRWPAVRAVLQPGGLHAPGERTLGNAPRTIDEARWPTQQFLDLSVQKNFAVDRNGKRRVQVRLDAINALNHPVFKFGRDSDNGEIFALPSEALISTADFNAWADFNQKPRAGR